MTPETVYEDENFLAIDKPAGMQVHEARIAHHKARSMKRGKQDVPRSTLQASGEETVVDWLLKNYPEVKDVGDDPTTRPGIVHRLDKETSGVMLVARNQKTFEYLKSLFQAGQIKKIYLALVFGKTPKQGVIEKPIGIRNGTLKRSVHSEKMAKNAITEYKTLRNVNLNVGGREKPFSLLEVSPKTGRTHQIRVHLASIGHPVAGDQLYGPEKLINNDKRPMTNDGHKSSVISHESPRLMLHALAIEFTKQDGGRVRFEASPPRQFQELIGEVYFFT